MHGNSWHGKVVQNRSQVTYRQFVLAEIGRYKRGLVLLLSR